MAISEAMTCAFRAAPVLDLQLMISEAPPEIPNGYALSQVAGVWLASDRQLRVTRIKNAEGAAIASLVGFVFSDLLKGFLPAGEVTLPITTHDVGELERLLLPDLSGVFVLFTEGHLPKRLYMDHGGSCPIVYAKEERRAASSPALLLEPRAYEERFRGDLHAALIGHEGVGGWISGTLTAHQGVSRLLPNHYLDLSDWNAHRFWPLPDEFCTWRRFDASAARAAQAISTFSEAACREFRVAATLTAGFDTRLLLAGCRSSVDRCDFFTLQAPSAQMDIDISRDLARRFGLSHQVLPLRQATNVEMAIWDRMVGDCVVETPRLTHTTLRQLDDYDVVLTGVFGEVGRCRLYRQDFAKINVEQIDARFLIDRLTLPRHPELVADIEAWLEGLKGQPNSVIMDLAYIELRCASWAMGQRPITNSVKLNFTPFAQRAVFEAFIGVAPEDKGTKALFWATIKALWPELANLKINKYGDLRDYLVLLKKASDLRRVQKFLRDRMARRPTAQMTVERNPSG